MRQHNLRVTGSLTVNGENVVSASQLSALTQTLTGQYATTGSNSYNGNQTITGSLLVTGVITANEFHTTFVTSSVLYTSGSTKFGDSNDDIMEVTGSLKVNGNITANNLSGIVSGSSQITSLLPTGVVSGSSQTILNLPTGVVSGSSQLTASYDVRYVISGSITQTTWDNIASKPAGIVSSSAQVILQSTTGQLSASRVDGLNLSQIASGSYTASIGQTFNVNTNTIITGSLTVTSLSGSGINYLAYSGGVVTAISGTAAIKYTQEFTATLGQTIFTPSVGYVTGLIDVFYNGTKLSTTDYTATNGSTIVLSQGADLAGDIIEVAIYNPVSGVSNNTLRQQTTFTASAAQTTFTVNYTPGLLDVYFNGSRLSNDEYTANNGTSIILSEAATGGEIVDIFVYSYQVGAFSGVGGSGVANQLAYWSSQSGLTGSNSLTFDGTTLTISGSLVPAVSGAYDLGSTSKPFRHIYVGSGSIFLVNNQGQVTNTISAQSIVTTDTLNSGSIDLTKSLPTGTVSGSSQVVGILTSLNTATASFTPRISNLESKSASVDISITNINSFTASNANTSLNSKTGSYATTGSNSFYGTQVFSGSVYIANDLIVQGSSSIQYISASSVSIGTNIIQLNTATPSVRYAGLSVQDSGSSAGVTGSILWDSLCNRWIYSNPSTIGYSGGMLMSGPRTSTLGTELPLTCNYIAKSGGGDHLYDSCISELSGSTCIFGSLTTTGTISGTDIYASNVSCSPLGVFTTLCATEIYPSYIGMGYTNIRAVGNKLGIGTANPLGVLSIVGGQNSLASLATYSSMEPLGIFNMFYTNSGTYPFYLDIAAYGDPQGSTGGSNIRFLTNCSNVGSTPVERMRITSAGYVGIGTCNPGLPLELYVPDGNGIRIKNSGSSDKRWDLVVSGNDFRINETGVGAAMTIKAGGSVGIGTPTPNIVGFTGTILTVNGTGNYQGFEVATSGTSRVAMISNGTDGYVSTRQTGMGLVFETGAAAERMRISGTGIMYAKCAINLTDVVSQSDADTWPVLNLSGANGLSGITNTSSAFDWGFIKGSTARGYYGRQVGAIHMSSAYDMGFYTSGWVAQLVINGSNGNAYLRGSLTQGSDCRLKANVCNLNYGISEIMQLRPVSYNKKTFERDNCGNILSEGVDMCNKYIGFIAQEVKPLVPEVVNGNENSENPEHGLSIEYQNMTALLVKGIQEQQCTIQCLTNRIEQLENK